MNDILEQLAILDKKKMDLNKEYSKLRVDFEKYITNKDIPLEIRWSMFANSPDELNHHEDYFIKAKSAGLQHIKDNWFDAPEVYGRGKRINTKELFEDIFEEDTLNYDQEYYDEDTIKLYKEAMEEILSQNCGSFCFDW